MSNKDFELWEVELASGGFEPESEVYGRSLSTIRRLGEYMIGRTHLEAVSSPEAAQAKVEFFTSVEEGFGTDIELGGGLEVRDFDERTIVGGRVMAKDLKTPISDMTHAGLVCAKQTFERDKLFLPQLIRSHWDNQNALAVDDMACGKVGYNTRIVVSPFPEEAAKDSGNEYWRNIGYVPHLKRGFVQIYHANEDGMMVSGSLSFDGCNKARLHQVFERFGLKVPQGESTDNWLKYAITDTLSEENAKKLALALANAAADPQFKKNTNTVDVTGRHRPLMDRVFNESYVHICESLVSGAQTEGTKKLVVQLYSRSDNFNHRYAQALQKMKIGASSFSSEDAIVLHELLVYSTIEMMRALHINKESIVIRQDIGMQEMARMIEMDSVSFQNALGGFGAEGAKNNRTYSACGLSISVGEVKNSPQDSFGGADKEKSEKKWMKCPQCKASVFDDPCAKILACWDCKAKVIFGKVTNGDGGHKARAERARQNRAEKRQRRSARLLVTHEKIAQNQGKISV